MAVYVCDSAVDMNVLHCISALHPGRQAGLSFGVGGPRKGMPVAPAKSGEEDNALSKREEEIRG